MSDPSKPVDQYLNETATKNRGWAKKFLRFRCASFSLRHEELTGVEPTGCELKNTLFWLRWDNTKKVLQMATSLQPTLAKSRFAFGIAAILFMSLLAALAIHQLRPTAATTPTGFEGSDKIDPSQYLSETATKNRGWAKSSSAFVVHPSACVTRS